MLTPEQVDAARKEYGITPPASGGGSAAGAPTIDRSAELASAWGTAPAASDPNAPDLKVNAQDATFRADGAEGPVVAAAKTVGNIPSSAINFGKGVLNFLNPLNAVKTAQDLGTSISAGLDEKNSPAKLAVDTAKEIPGTAYKMLVPQFLQHIFSGDLKSAAATIENDPVGQIAPLLMLAKSTATAAGKGAEFDSAMSKIASPATKPATAVKSGVGSAATGGARFLAGQLTGISPDTIQNIIKNPQEFSKSAEADITRPNLAQQIATAIKTRQGNVSDLGSEYGGIHESSTPVKVDPAYLRTLVEAKTGLKFEYPSQKGTSTTDANGKTIPGEAPDLSKNPTPKLVTSGSATIRTPADIAQLQHKLIDVWEPEFAKGQLTPKEFLNFRNDLSKMAYNDNGVKSTDLGRLSSTLRKQANGDLRPSVPGLKELDTKFAPEKTQLSALSKGLVDKQGNLSDAAINKIAGAAGKGKDPLLGRLEQLSPGVTDKVKLLKAVEDLQSSREVKTGTYLRAGALGAGIAGMNPFLIVSAIASIPEVAVPLLRGLGYSAKTIASLTKTLGIPKATKALKGKVAPAAVKLAPGATATNQEQQ